MNHREESICDAAKEVRGFSFGKLTGDDTWGPFMISVCGFMDRTFSNRRGEQDLCPNPQIPKTCLLGFHKKTELEIHDECSKLYEFLGNDVVEFLDFKTYI